MGIFSNAVPDLSPGTHVQVHLLVAAHQFPDVSADVQDVGGSPTMFVRLEVDDRTSGRPRHAANFSMSGPPAAVRALIAELARIVGEAQ